MSGIHILSFSFSYLLILYSVKFLDYTDINRNQFQYDTSYNWIADFTDGFYFGK